MREIPASVMATINSYPGRIAARTMVWIKARQISDDTTDFWGFWNGEEDLVINMAGSRTYFGAGALLNAPNIMSEVGVVDYRVTLDFNNLDNRIKNAVLAYDYRMAFTEIHSILLNPDNNRPLSDPWLQFQGFVDTMNDIDPAVSTDDPELNSQGSKYELILASKMRMFTKTLPLMHSYRSILRNNNDQFGKYADLTGKVISQWQA